MNTKNATIIGLCVAILGVNGCASRMLWQSDKEKTGDESLVAFEGTEFGDETQEKIETILRENGAEDIDIDEDNGVIAKVSANDYEKLIKAVENFKDLT